MCHLVEINRSIGQIRGKIINFSWSSINQNANTCVKVQDLGTKPFTTRKFYGQFFTPPMHTATSSCTMCSQCSYDEEHSLDQSCRFSGIPLVKLHCTSKISSLPLYMFAHLATVPFRWQNGNSQLLPPLLQVAAVLHSEVDRPDRDLDSIVHFDLTCHCQWQTEGSHSRGTGWWCPLGPTSAKRVHLLRN